MRKYYILASHAPVLRAFRPSRVKGTDKYSTVPGIAGVYIHIFEKQLAAFICCFVRGVLEKPRAATGLRRTRKKGNPETGGEKNRQKVRPRF